MFTSNDDREKHLPLYGIGPALCFPMIIITAIGILLSIKGIIPGSIENNVIKWIMVFSGMLFIVVGLAMFFGADLNGKLQNNIKANQLKANGAYMFVRNPCYCAFLLGSTGVFRLLQAG